MIAKDDPNSNEPAITEILLKWQTEGDEASGELIKVVYNELHWRAANYMRHERPDHTLQPTALVNEVYLRLANQKHIVWQNRAQFYAVAAQMMRRVLVDHARNKAAHKRGDGAVRVSLTEIDNPFTQPDIDMILLDNALNELSLFDARQSQIVELKFFAGLSVEEIAETLNISTATVVREWRVAKMWLYNALQGR